MWFRSAWELNPGHTKWATQQKTKITTQSYYHIFKSQPELLVLFEKKDPCPRHDTRAWKSARVGNCPHYVMCVNQWLLSIPLCNNPCYLLEGVHHKTHFFPWHDQYGLTRSRPHSPGIHCGMLMATKFTTTPSRSTLTMNPHDIPHNLVGRLKEIGGSDIVALHHWQLAQNHHFVINIPQGPKNFSPLSKPIV